MIQVVFRIEGSHYINGSRIQPGRIYKFPPHRLAALTLPYEIVQPDDSQVGTVLAQRFKSWGFHARSGCGCGGQKLMLDQCSLDWIMENRESLAKTMAQNVKYIQPRRTLCQELLSRTLGWIAQWRPALFLKWCLMWAVINERRRLRRNGIK